MLGKAATFLPIGDIPFRVNLMSALCGAAAALAVFALARVALAPALPRRPRSVELAAAAAALVVAFSWAAWFQAVRAEVYALEAALAIGALAAALAYRRSRAARHLILFALLGAAAAANHSAIAAAPLVAGAALILWRRRPRARHLSLAAVAAVLALGSLAYLPVRAAAHPEPNFAAPSTASRFLWTVSGRAFHKATTSERVSSRGEDAAQIVVAIAESATIPLAILALVAIAAAATRRAEASTVAALAATAALAIAARAVLGFDPETPDHHGYLIPAIAAVVVLGALGLATLAAAVDRGPGPPALAAPVAAAALALLVPVQLATVWGDADLSEDAASNALARFEIDAPPPRALLLTAYFETHFRLMALRAVEGARPDLVDLDRSFLTYPGMAAEARRRHPELADLIDAPLRAGAPSPVELLDIAGRRRPVMAELHPNLDEALAARLVPTGPFAAYLPGANSRLETAAEHRTRRAGRAMESLLATGSEAERERARLALLWREYRLAEHYCRRGRQVAAALAYRSALARAPRDRTLAELANRCHLEEEP
jgi:hypothetical protein